MADIRLDCPSCGEHLELDEALGGQRIKCPACNNEFTNPGRPDGPVVARMARKDSAAPAENPGGERDLFELKPTARAYVGSILFGILLIPFFFIGLILLIRVWYKVASKKYRLTTQRLFIQEGLIAKHLEELELFRIKDVTVTQGILERLFGAGTVIVLSTDDTNPRVALAGIGKPVDVKEKIRNAATAARKREGVRTSEFIKS